MQHALDEDLYAILESSSSASYEELKANYRKLILKYHPDKLNEEEREVSSFEFQRLDQAWKILSNPGLRHQYDTQQRADQLTCALVHDEIELHEMTWHQDDLTYIYPCRCGGDYTLSRDNASGSRTVNCSNCSLYINVSVEQQPDKSTQNDMTKR